MRPLVPLPLADDHLRLLSLRASGYTMPRAAARLGLAINTLYTYASETNRQLGVTSPEAAVHVCYLARFLLPRPATAGTTLAFCWEERTLLRLLATGATVAQTAAALGRCTSTISCRIKGLLRRTQCTSRPQLITLGWCLGLLHEAHVQMADGARVLLPPAHPTAKTAAPIHRAQALTGRAS
ncbi:helix-turn-helix transcriptional regulator [Streptomyces sp. NPDC087440]|uniref:helix-turn-helix transcriptional regulator n=1 Tax=Streptomyces sp. NPDC087440 TaxID=3365790 RepID=UPI0038211A2A